MRTRVLSFPSGFLFALLTAFILIISVHNIAAQQNPKDSGPGRGQEADERIRVHVLPMANLTGRSRYDAAARGVGDTMRLTLRLLGSYDISSGIPDGFGKQLPLPGGRDARLRVLGRIAEELSVENIVFGGVVPTDGEGEGEESELPQIELHVYDRLEQEVVQSESRQPESLFDFFGATDRITGALLSSFSGRRVAFGTLRMEPSGGEASYLVSVDGNRIGRDMRSVDSLLVGRHEVVIEAGPDEIAQEVYSGEVEIAEGETTTVPFELPTAEEVSLQAARARQAEALELIMAERARLSTENFGMEALVQTQRIFLEAGEYYDPVELKRAAEKNARLSAGYADEAARASFSEKEYETGASAMRELERTAIEFGADRELYGYEEDVGFVAHNWYEYDVQKRRSPSIWLPAAIGSLGILMGILEDGPSEDGIPPSKINSISLAEVPFAPILTTAGIVGLWNALDWDYGRKSGALVAYGKQERRPSASWSPAPIELSAGAGLSLAMLTLSYPFSTEVANTGADHFFVDNGLATGVIEGRYWFNEHHAAGFSILSTIPVVGISPPQFTLHIDDVDLHSLYDFKLLGNWRYTRTGKAYIQLGAGWRWMAPDLKSREGDLTQQGYDAYVEVLGSENPRIDAMVQELGLGFRFGSNDRRSWDLMLRYTVEELFFHGSLSRSNPFIRHGVDLHITRAFALPFVDRGEARGAAGTGQQSKARTASAFVREKEEAEERWKPLPISLYADLAGFAYGGSRYGFEYSLGQHVSAGLYARLGFNAEDVFNDDTPETPRNAGWPGASLRYFLPLLDRRVYMGAVFEYAPLDDYDVRGESSETAYGSVGYTEGSLFIAQTELGIRFPIGKSGYIDLGGMAGWAFGSFEKRWTDFDSSYNEVSSDSDYRIGNQLWLNPVLAFGVKLY